MGATPSQVFHGDFIGNTYDDWKRSVTATSSSTSIAFTPTYTTTCEPWTQTEYVAVGKYSNLTWWDELFPNPLTSASPSQQLCSAPAYVTVTYSDSMNDLVPRQTAVSYTDNSKKSAKNSCPGDNGKSYTATEGNKAKYLLECFVDYFDHDVGLSYQPDWEACMNACSSFNGCNAIVFHAPEASPGATGPCYLKSEGTGASSNPSVMAAKVVRNSGGYGGGSSASSASSAPSLSSKSTASAPSGYAGSSTSSAPIVTVKPTSSKATLSNTHTSVSTAPILPPPNNGSEPNVSCGILNHKSNTFWLRTHVVYGDKRFDGLYVQNVAQGAPAQTPVLSDDHDHRGQFYYDSTSLSVALWHGNCYFSGVEMVPNGDLSEGGPVYITASTGTPRMAIEGGQLVWLNDRFGTWLACETDGEVKLSYWDVQYSRGVDETKCASIQLLTEAL